MSETTNPTPEAESTAQARPEGTTSQPSNEVKTLQQKLVAAEAKNEEYLNLARQIKADFENYQKRSLRDAATEKRFAQAPLAADLIPALDNLDRALDAAKAGGDDGALAKGVAMVQSQILATLGRHGVTRMEALHQPFDPNHHEAVMQQPNAEHPPQTVIQVLAHGYMLHERVLRPASVIVTISPN
jgi:molecular chaperone GrpE